MGAASDLLSGLAGGAGLVVTPERDAPVRHAEIVSIGAGQALLVLVFEDNQVENRIINTPPDLPAGAMTEAANYLNARFKGRTLAEARAAATEALARDRAALDQSATTLLKQYQGALRKLAQSEALSSGNISRVFRTISEACCSLLQVKRASIWLLTNKRAGIKLVDVCTSGRQHSNPTFVFEPSHLLAYLRSLTRNHRAIAVRHTSRDPRFKSLAQSYLFISISRPC